MYRSALGGRAHPESSALRSGLTLGLLDLGGLGLGDFDDRPLPVFVVVMNFMPILGSGFLTSGEA